MCCANVWAKTNFTCPIQMRWPKASLMQFYLNTADCMSFAPMMKKMYKCPIFAHIHELNYSLQAYFPSAFTLENTSAISHYIAASNSVKKNLTSRQGIAADMATVINEMISVSALSKTAVSMAVAKKELGVAGHFTVGAAGQAGWRKGTDWFLQVASNVIKQLPANRIKFVWVGYQSAEEYAQAVYEAEKLGLEKTVIFTGLKESPQDYYQLFDLFSAFLPRRPFSTCRT
jgi:glycosyltransferase involved in cell wall biosynthesis